MPIKKRPCPRSEEIYACGSDVQIITRVDKGRIIPPCYHHRLTAASEA